MWGRVFFQNDSGNQKRPDANFPKCARKQKNLPYQVTVCGKITPYQAIGVKLT